MADTEFRAPSARDLEPTFVNPLDTASHRFSRISSAAASTRSWVLMNQQSPPPPPVEPIPLPEPVSALTPVSTTTPRPLPEPPRRIDILDSTDGEHMEVPTPGEAEAALGYQWTTGRGAKAREKGFVGGFVSGLRRLPRALVRTRRARRGTLGTEQTDGETELSGNTLPRYVSNPPTPVVAEANVRFLRPGGLDTTTDDSRRPRHPSFRLDPPAEDVQQVVTPVVLHPDDTHSEGEGMPGDFPQGPPDTPYEPPLENPYDHDVTPSNHPISPPALSPHPSRAGDHLALPLDGDEPVSVHAHPLPADDYRRMSAADAAHGQARSGTTISSGSFSTESPSFSNELSGFHRFFNALHLMPWVATDRITVDYQPKSKPRVGVSWYQPAPPADAALDRERAPISPASEEDHRRHRRRRTHHHHRETVPPNASPATPPVAYGIPVTYAPYSAFSPPHQPLPPRPSSPRRRSSPRPRAQAHQTRSRHHHRRSGAYHTPAPPQNQTFLPAPQVPAPVYVIQTSPQSTAFTGSPPPPGMPGQDGSAAGTVGSGSGSGSKRTSAAGSGSAQLLAPVYMQMQMMPGAGAGGNNGHGHGERSVAFFPASPGLAYAYPYPYAAAAAYPSPGSPHVHGHGQGHG
ncbi:hypothetical protein FB45DRAFT_149767 [Roridomyces roridus]|uniref:Uncharacterized protein n=1 Tax=Roridomyces roridus TaxID=1738132 RepID=A0AAD7BH45_9AGAR|nr:hypothetical protein FB45DRAFT_149767 [Roridomyces roridus]